LTHPLCGLRHLRAFALRQGRYRAILLDPDAVGSVCHYIHLNPARAGIVEAAALEQYEASSFHQLWNPGRRWSFVDYDSCLEAAGGLVDKPKGRQLYRDYLCQISSDDSAQKRLGFEEMCRGWAKGTDEFKKAVLADQKESIAGRRVVESEASEVREPKWEAVVLKALELVARSEAELSSSRKGAEWKVSMARLLRERFLALHAWIAQRLDMGGAGSVQSLVSRHRREQSRQIPSWEILKSYDFLD
jgi:hypothetical protein